MTKRQVSGFAMACALLLGLAFFHWLAPILDYRAPNWCSTSLGRSCPSDGWRTIGAILRSIDVIENMTRQPMQGIQSSILRPIPARRNLR